MIGSALGVAVLNASSGVQVSLHHLRDALMSFGPVALWNLDDAALPTAVDYTGHGHDATFAASGGGTIALRQGPVPPNGEGSSVLFDSLGNTVAHATAPAHANFNLTVQGSLAIWSECSFGHFNPLLIKDDQINGWGIYSRDGIRLAMYNRGPGGLSVTEFPPVGGVAGPHLMVGAWNAGAAWMWMDGVLVFSVGAGWNVPGVNANPVEIASGAASVGIDGMQRLAFGAVYGSALTNANVQTIWNESHP